MSKTYNNLPMSESLAKSTEKMDAFYTGPKLIALITITLVLAFTLLWLMAADIVGPKFHDDRNVNEIHNYYVP
ncbi:MAG: hypothetical protein KC543_13540 [Myxococcales bacterium]|nr:hypothetical protein [Myxococcales bacterium]